MREIKFRAWDARNHKMFIPSELIHPPLEVGYFDDSGCPKGMNNAPLMQYTGLKDKNGKEIYEGDIVELYKYQGEALYCVTLVIAVKWNETGLNFNIWKPHENEFWKVIGNIYENKELLEAK